MAPDILLVSLGTTAGLRASDAAFAACCEAAGACVEVLTVPPAREVRTLMATDLLQALAARRALAQRLAGGADPPRAIVHSTTTAALLAAAPGAIRFDSGARTNRPGRHGLWQRSLEARRLRTAPLLIPTSVAGLREAGGDPVRAVVVPIPVEPSGPLLPAAQRDIAAITYAANPAKKGLDRVLSAWHAAARRSGEELVVCGTPPGAPQAGVGWAGLLPPEEYRALLRRARVFVTAPRREDYGIAQLEALADGCALVTTDSPGPSVAVPLARGLDPRWVVTDPSGDAEPGALASALAAALDDPPPELPQRAQEAVAPFRRAAVEQVVARELLPRLLP